jgi:hypothetical protein
MATAFELLRDRGIEPMAPLTIDRAKLLHRRLGEDLAGIVPSSGEDRAILATPCFLGQPIKAARHGDGWTGALRIAISAPMVSDDCRGDGARHQRRRWHPRDHSKTGVHPAKSGRADDRSRTALQSVKRVNIKHS